MTDDSPLQRLNYLQCEADIGSTTDISSDLCEATAKVCDFT